MAHNYTGSAAGVTPATPLTITEPDDGDPLNVASVEPTVFQLLANWIAFLFSFVPFLGNAAGGASYNNNGPVGGVGLTVIGGGFGGGNSSGIDGVGAGTGYGVRGANGDSGPAVQADQTGTGIAVKAAAAGVGSAVQGTNTGAGFAGEFSTTGGTGDAISAGAGNARALNALNNSAAATIEASNGGAGPALKATSVVAGHVGKALAIADGLISFDGGLSPAAATALKNAITPMLCIKAWALVTTSGGGGVTLVDGQNVSGVTLVNTGGGAGEGIEVAWAQPFASDNVGVLCFASYGAQFAMPNMLNSGTLSLLRNAVDLYFCNRAGAVVPAATSAIYAVIVALGAQ